MPKLFGQNIKEGVTAGELKREIGEIVIENEDGERTVLNEAGLLKYLEDLFAGGKTITQAEKEMISDGIKDGQWKKRQELIALLEKIGSH